jgi:hypothetical protein
MTLDQLQSFLLWGAALSYVVLLVAFATWVFAGDWMYRLHARWFAIDRAQCHRSVYLMLGVYKLGIWLFFVVPWLALLIVRSQGGAP